jgi:hypothetical protein
MKYPEQPIINLIYFLSRSFIFILIVPTFLLAGPPFLTDDPQPVDFMHWEFYISSQSQFSDNNVDATLPHFEINYGLIPDVQVHLIVPMQYSKRETSIEYSYVSTEVGVKYRFINLDNGIQAGVFPIAEVPTGKNVSLAGENNLKVFLPLWLQISYGKFTSYGGAGYWINPGTGNKNWVYAGWQGQYDFSETITLGGELYYHTADSNDSEGGVGFNLGGYININEHNHLLFSIGHNLTGANTTTGYVGYQLTI